MKTLEQFEAIKDNFNERINGKKGEAFVLAVTQFMREHKFEKNVFVCLHESDVERIMFFTDHPFNDAGIIFIEAFDVISFFYIGSKAEAKKIIQRRQ